MWEAVSSWLIFLSSPSFWGPCGSLATCASSRAFSAAIRSSNVWGMDRRRCMTRPRAYGSLAVGFAGADANMPSPGDLFRSEHSQIGRSKSTWNDRGHAVPASGRASRSYEMKEAANRSGLQLIGLRSFLIILRWSLPYSSATCRAWSVRVGLSFGSSSGACFFA